MGVDFTTELQRYILTCIPSWVKIIIGYGTDMQVVTTGSQGEPNAQLTKAAVENAKDLKINQSDLLLYRQVGGVDLLCTDKQ